MLARAFQRYLGVDLSTVAGRALIEERYWSLRQQVPIIYVLGLVNLSAMEIAADRSLSLGFNLPTFILMCALLRLRSWFGEGSEAASHEMMVRRMSQTVFFAAAVCVAVCWRCLYLLGVGDTASHMAVILFGGLTAIGVAYGSDCAARCRPYSLDPHHWTDFVGRGLVSKEREFVGAAFGLVVVAGLTVQLLSAHSKHFTNVIRSRSNIAVDQKRAEHAHQEAMIAAPTDFLTGLPNRRAFVSALEDAIAARAGRFSLAILDLNRFKAVNDTFGHAIGDKLLEEVALRLGKAVGEQRDGCAPRGRRVRIAPRIAAIASRTHAGSARRFSSG